MNPFKQKAIDDLSKKLKLGKLGLICYKMYNDENCWVVREWGNYDELSAISEKLIVKYKSAGFHDKAQSLTLVELPNDANVIYEVLSGLSIKEELNKMGVKL